MKTTLLSFALLIASSAASLAQSTGPTSKRFFNCSSVQPLPQRFCLRIPEQFFKGGVNDLDPFFHVVDHHGDGRLLHQAVEQFLLL